MPSTFKSPFATSFKTAVKRGTSFTTAVQTIATRSGKTTDTVWQSLYKAGLVWRQKINGKWIYWPSFTGKKSVSGGKVAQIHQWQWFVDWCITSGYAKPTQFKKGSGTQPSFLGFARKYFGRQFTTGTTTKSHSRSTTRGTTYKFPTTKSRTRRYSRAA